MLERQAPAVTGAAFRRSSGIIPSSRKGWRFDLMTQTDGNGANGGVAARSARDAETDKARLRAIHAALTAGDVGGAGKMAEDALGDGVDHVMVLSLVAGRREGEGRFADALALLERARAAAPGAAGIANQLGLALLRLERWEEAADAFGEAATLDSRFAPALSNRAMAWMALARFDEAGRDFAAAAALDPTNLVAANGLAALALRRGETEEARRLAGQVLAREPGFPGAVTTLAGAALADGRAAEAEAALRALLGDGGLAPVDRAIAWGLLGDALDAQRQYGEAFAAWREANAAQALQHRAEYGGGQSTLDLVRDLAAALAGKRIPAAFGHGGRSLARRHVFLVGFPRAGGDRIADMLGAHPGVALLAQKECLIDAARDWMGDAVRFAAFLAAEDDALETYRDAYWRRVAEEGADPAGRVFVDAHAYNSFKLPLIARLFPDARVVFARRDPKDNVLACFRGRFAMTAPAWEMLTLEGAADLFAATMEMAEASRAAFGLYLHEVSLEGLLADAAGETKAICDFIGIERTEAMSIVAGDVRDLGKGRDYEAEMAGVLPVLAPWAEPLGAR